MALTALIDEYESVQESQATFDHRLQKLVHCNQWRNHVFARLNPNQFHKYKWESEFEQEFPVFVCDSKVQCAVALKRITLATQYTHDSPIRHYLVRRVFPFFRNHAHAYFLVPERCYCDGHWVRLVLPMPMIMTHYIEVLHSHDESKVTVATSKDVELDRCGKQYQLKAFLDLAREDTEDDQGFRMCIHAVKETFPGISDERLKSYGEEIKNADEGPETADSRIRGDISQQAKVGISISFFDQLETMVANEQVHEEHASVESTLVGSWYHDIEGCELP